VNILKNIQNIMLFSIKIILSSVNTVEF